MTRISDARKRLINLANLYLDALAENNPSRITVTPDVKFTENTKTLALGEGLWETASAIKYRHIVVDPLAHQAGVFCTLHEGSEYLTLFSLRLKELDGKVSEIETLVSRYAGMDVAWNPKALVTPHPIFNEIVPENQRSSRKRLIEIADIYFEALEKSNPEHLLVYDNCNRLENGLLTVNNPSLSEFTGWSCKEQMYLFTYMTRIRDRRYEIVNEERGLVWCMVMFDIPGKVKTAEIPGRGTIELPERTQYPRSFLLGEVFKIRDGLIEYIEAILTSVPLGTRPGWP